MIKQFVAVFTMVLLVAVGCSKPKDYSDVKKFLNDSTKAFETQIDALEKAKTGKEVAAVLTKIKDMSIESKKKGDELSAKFPELKNQKEVPAELKPLYEKLMEVAKKSGTVTMAVMKKYEKDADVMKALKM